jgi:hypothetical protein
MICAVAGAFAFIYYGEPFETKDLDLMMKLSLTQGGLVDVAPVFRHFVDGGAVAEGLFLRLSRILVDIVPAADALDDEALREAVDHRKLESVLGRHHLLEAWRRLQPAL